MEYAWSEVEGRARRWLVASIGSAPAPPQVSLGALAALAARPLATKREVNLIMNIWLWAGACLRGHLVSREPARCSQGGRGGGKFGSEGVAESPTGRLRGGPIEPNLPFLFGGGRTAGKEQLGNNRERRPLRPCGYGLRTAAHGRLLARSSRLIGVANSGARNEMGAEQEHMASPEIAPHKLWRRCLWACCGVEAGWGAGKKEGWVDRRGEGLQVAGGGVHERGPGSPWALKRG